MLSLALINLHAGLLIELGLFPAPRPPCASIQINAHSSAGLPPDTQLLKFVAQAINLNEGLLRETTTGSPEHDHIVNQLALLTNTYNSALRQLQEEGIPIPPETAALPIPTQQLLSQRLPPPPPALLSACAPPPSQSGDALCEAAQLPRYALTSCCSSGSEPAAPSPAAVDVSRLLNDLAAAGYITPSRGTSSTPSVPPPPPPVLQTAAHHSLPSGAGAQPYGCPAGPQSSAGLNMPTGGMLSRPGGTLASLNGGCAGTLAGLSSMPVGTLGGGLGGVNIGAGPSCAMSGINAATSMDRTITSALHELYNPHRQQCSVCGLCFGPNSREDFSQHMAHHYKGGSSQAIAKGAPPLSRRWLSGLDDWVAASPIRQAGVQQASAFDAGKPTTDVEALGSHAKMAAAMPHSVSACQIRVVLLVTVCEIICSPLPASFIAAPTVQVVRAPRDTSRVECLNCGEEIPITYDPDNDDWFLKDAVDAGGGQFHHVSCTQ